MADIELYNDLTPVSNEWLRRYQVPTDRAIDRTSLELLKVFINTLDPNMERLPGLGAEPLDEANKFLTVELKNIGVDLGRHPSREIERANKMFKFIRSHPQVTYSINKNGVKEYYEVPLLKYAKITSDGKCKLIFNDALRYFFFPEKNFALCSFTLLSEIRQRNVYSSIIFEEACSYEGMFRYNKVPSFTWSMKNAREKFSFDQIKDISKDRTAYVTDEIKKMRPNNMMSNVIKPALAVLEELFKESKIKFWVDIEINADLKKSHAGRPPKDLFRFILRKERKSVIVNTPADGEQPGLFDDYVEMNTLYYIQEQLKIIIKSKKYIKMIMEQLKNNEQKGTHEDVLATIKSKRSDYDKKTENERASLILSVLGKEHHLGDPSKFGKPCKNDERFWPDDLEGRIKVMMESSEIKDRAARERGLSSEDVDTLLQGDFYQICLKNNKLQKDWSDAVSYFFNWLNRLGIQGPLQNVSFGNNKHTKSNYGQTTTSSTGAVAFEFFNEPADEFDR